MKFEVYESKAAGAVTVSRRMRILLVDADTASSRFLALHLSKRSFDVSTAFSGDEAVRLVRALNPSLVLLDLGVAGGLEVLDRIRQIAADVPFIISASKADPEAVFRASKAGAEEFITKPYDLKEVDQCIGKVIERRLTIVPKPAPATDQQPRSGSDFSMLFGTSPKMEDVKETIEKVADTTATVLIRGESGTGKEMVARMIYAQSGRHDRPFVKVNCAAIPNELLESELFGYEQGAFTGANRQKLGKFDQANQGTIFLDEISEMHPALQAKLLHVLQDGEFARLGGKKDIAVDVRVLAATNKPLEKAVSMGTFREDLFYRLNVVTVHIPPLRERREEIPVFLEFFLRKYSELYAKNPPPFSENAMARMMEYSWPGNIRELENLVKRYTIVGNEAHIIRELATHKPIVTSTGHDHQPEFAVPTRPLPPVTNDGDADAPSLLEIGRRAAMKAEREAIERVLTQTRWNRRQAAKILKISYKALLNKLKLMEEQDQAETRQGPA